MVKINGCTQRGDEKLRPAGCSEREPCSSPLPRKIPVSSCVSRIHVAKRSLSVSSFLPPGNEKWPDQGSIGFVARLSSK